MPVSDSILNAIRHYCAYQERCHSEVRSKLISLSCYGAELEEALSIMIEEGLLNEERFAIAYTRGKFRMNRWGRQKIAQQLKVKKVSEYCIRKGLQQIDDREYFDVLEKAACKKWASLKGLRQEWQKRYKVQQYLTGRGFESDLINDVLNAIAENH